MTTLTSTIDIVDMPKRTLAFVHHVGLYAGRTALFQQLFTKVADWAAPKGLLDFPGSEAISLYHDDSITVPEEKQRISVGFTVPEGTLGDGEVDVMELKAGRYAFGSFTIPVEEYEEAWAEMMDYLKSVGLEKDARYVYESYRNDPNTHPDGLHMVDICIGLD